MARKVVNRKELRREADAAERAGTTEKTTEKKAPAKRKSRAKVVKEIRYKAFWGVFNQSGKRVALFQHAERKLADKKKQDLTESSKTPHFVQRVTEAIDD